MYRTGADSIGFTTGGTNRLTIDGTGATFGGHVKLGNTSRADHIYTYYTNTNTNAPS